MPKSDKIRSRNKPSKKSLNPFEHQIQKSKFKVLNRREKSNKGTPGASTKKAELLRKNTIGVDLKNLNKSNKFFDNRITAKDGDFDASAIKRIASLRKKVQGAQLNRRNKASKFHLNDDSDDDSDGNNGDSSDDDELLTSKGRPLENIKHHILNGELEAASRDQNENLSSARQMNELNFGGGTNRNSALLTPKMTREEAINDMIKQSKIQKFQKQQEHSELLETIAEVDSQWLEIEKNSKIINEKTTMGKYEKADYGKDKGHDDWCALVDSLKHAKKVTADKSISKKTEMQLLNEKKKLERKREMELIYEQPEDERVDEKENWGLGEVRQKNSKKIFIP